jgi:hypothetical protein
MRVTLRGTTTAAIWIRISTTSRDTYDLPIRQWSLVLSNNNPVQGAGVQAIAPADQGPHVGHGRHRPA